MPTNLKSLQGGSLFFHDVETPSGKFLHHIEMSKTRGIKSCLTQSSILQGITLVAISCIELLVSITLLPCDLFLKKRFFSKMAINSLTLLITIVFRTAFGKFPHVDYTRKSLDELVNKYDSIFIKHFSKNFDRNNINHSNIAQLLFTAASNKYIKISEEISSKEEKASRLEDTKLSILTLTSKYPQFLYNYDKMLLKPTFTDLINSIKSQISQTQEKAQFTSFFNETLLAYRALVNNRETSALMENPIERHASAPFKTLRDLINKNPEECLEEIVNHHWKIHYSSQARMRPLDELHVSQTLEFSINFPQIETILQELAHIAQQQIEKLNKLDNETRHQISTVTTITINPLLDIIASYRRTFILGEDSPHFDPFDRTLFAMYLNDITQNEEAEDLFFLERNVDDIAQEKNAQDFITKARNKIRAKPENIISIINKEKAYLQKFPAVLISLADLIFRAYRINKDRQDRSSGKILAEDNLKNVLTALFKINPQVITTHFNELATNYKKLGGMERRLEILQEIQLFLNDITASG